MYPTADNIHILKVCNPKRDGSTWMKMNKCWNDGYFLILISNTGQQLQHAWLKMDRWCTVGKKIVWSPVVQHLRHAVEHFSLYLYSDFSQRLSQLAKILFCGENQSVLPLCLHTGCFSSGPLLLVRDVLEKLHFVFPFECGKYSITFTHSGAMTTMKTTGVLTVMATMKKNLLTWLNFGQINPKWNVYFGE